MKKLHTLHLLRSSSALFLSILCAHDLHASSKSSASATSPASSQEEIVSEFGTSTQPTAKTSAASDTETVENINTVADETVSSPAMNTTTAISNTYSSETQASVSQSTNTQTAAAAAQQINTGTMTAQNQTQSATTSASAPLSANSIPQSSAASAAATSKAASAAHNKNVPESTQEAVSMLFGSKETPPAPIPGANASAPSIPALPTGLPGLPGAAAPTTKSATTQAIPAISTTKSIPTTTSSVIATAQTLPVASTTNQKTQNTLTVPSKVVLTTASVVVTRAVPDVTAPTATQPVNSIQTANIQQQATASKIAPQAMSLGTMQPNTTIDAVERKALEKELRAERLSNEKLKVSRVLKDFKAVSDKMHEKVAQQASKLNNNPMIKAISEMAALTSDLQTLDAQMREREKEVSQTLDTALKQIKTKIDAILANPNATQEEKQTALNDGNEMNNIMQALIKTKMANQNAQEYIERAIRDAAVVRNMFEPLLNAAKSAEMAERAASYMAYTAQQVDQQTAIKK